ncbi:MAG: hypothetical protein H6797_00710 [Candidatus Nomurabacteria bacterium]|nr:MAG: hypothetical protein H6797_00710 [Candidatus Nomurabacteria bacterium]
MIEMVPHEDDHGHEHHHVTDYEPKPDSFNEVEPINPDLLSWYQQQDEVVFDVVPHSHLDYAWYRDREASKMREIEAFVKTVKVDRFTLEQMITAKEFVEGGGKRVKEDLLEMIRDERMELIGLYIQPEVFLSPEESTFWNIEFGQRAARELGGNPSSVAYIPDTFGFPDTMATMLKHAGVDSFLFERGFEQIDTIGAMFMLEGPDGSKVLAMPMQGGYSNAGGLTSVHDVDREAVSAEKYYEKQVDFATLAVRSLINRYGQRYKQIDMPHFLLMNGNDFTKPDEDLPRVLAGVQEKIRQEIPNFTIKTSSLENYAELVQRSIKPEQIKTYAGEMRSGKEHFVLRGIDSARMELKQFLHKVESRINDAGALVSHVLLARKYGLVGENEHATWQLVEAYQRAIEQVLPVLSHDTISGCGSDNAYPLPRSLMTGSFEAANQAARNAMAALANRLDTYGPYRHIERGQSFANMLPDARTALVEVPIQGDIEHATGLRAFVSVNGRETEIPVQIVQKRDIRYAVCALPMKGFSSANVRLEPTDKVQNGQEVRTFNGSFENECYTVDVLPNGTLHVVDKRSGVEVNGLIFEDQGDRGDEYNFCPVDGDVVRTTNDGKASVTVINDGPVFTEIKIDTELVVPKSLDAEQGADREVESLSADMTTIPISTKVRLIKGVDRVEFSTTVNNMARDHRLRVRFSAPNAANTVRAKEPYGMTRREALPIKGGKGWMEPHPVATSHQQGLLIAGDLALMSKGLPEYEAHADDNDMINGVSLTLLRSVGYLSRGNLSSRPGWAGPGSATPEAQLIGEHTFEYAIHTRGRQRDSDVIRQANDYTHKAEHGFEKAVLNGIINVESDGAVMSALRPTADGEAVLARFYNPSDEPTVVKLSGVFTTAVKCDALGEPLDDSDAHEFEMPKGIVTVRLS